MASNYYLAGAARYYFNGDLTFNKDLALFHEYRLGRESETESNNHKDEWNKDVCRRLNALILILRNSYIDTVGTRFEQPEDFGNMDINRLLRKYDKKIEKYLFGEQEKEEKDRKNSTVVGNGYTFDIIYSFNDAKKYYTHTSPGAWCISYSESNYRRYIKQLNIHYVIFRKDGLEKVERKPNRDMWVKSEYGDIKPQDEYGNSLIALLQSNVDGHPVYITSRWNHGSSDCGYVEVDHAYSTEEFMRTTGVDREDLEKIFRIWKENADKKAKNNQKSRAEIDDTVRRLKEAQIRINGGDDPKKYFHRYTSVVGNGDNLRKGLFQCYYKNESIDKNYFCLIDNGKICFESIFEVSYFYGNERFCDVQDRYSFYDKSTKKCIIYNYRLHKIVCVDGCVKFMEIPSLGTKTSNMMFYSLAKTKNDIALLDYRTDMPVKLPNGDVWSADIIDNNTNSYYENKIRAHNYGVANGIVLEMIYDLSSGEKYFFNMMTRKFFEPPKLSISPQLDKEYNLSNWEPLISPVPGLSLFPNKLFCLEYKDVKNTNDDRKKINRYNHTSPLYLYEENGTPFEIRGDNSFRFINCLEGRLLVFKKTFPNERGTMSVDRFCWFYDAKNGNLVEMEDVIYLPMHLGLYKYIGKMYFFYTCSDTRNAIYSLDDKRFVMNEKTGFYRMDYSDVEKKIREYIEKNSMSYDSRTGEPSA